MQWLSVPRQGIGYLLCLSLMACASTSNGAISTEDLPESQDSAIETTTDLPGNTPVPIGGESVGVPNTQPGTTTKTSAKISDIGTQSGNDDPGAHQQARDAANRVENVCSTLYAYDPEDTGVNVRDQPNGDVITQVPNLSSVYRADDPYAWIEPDTWNHIKLPDGTQGYLWGALLRHTAYRVYDPNDTAANLRAVPGGDVIVALPNDTEVEFLGEEGDWTHVRLGRGTDGYIATLLLGTPNCF